MASSVVLQVIPQAEGDAAQEKANAITVLLILSVVAFGLMFLYTGNPLVTALVGTGFVVVTAVVHFGR